MLLHAIGAHYTYSKVPYDDWMQVLTGFRLNDLLGFQRNHFDRLEHFLYWAAAAFFGGDLGVAYLGTQGDVWDAQKDMALAMGGTLLAVDVSRGSV